MKKEFSNLPLRKGVGIVLLNKENKIQDLIKTAEKETIKSEISDQAKYLADQKIQVLRSIN